MEPHGHLRERGFPKGFVALDQKPLAARGADADSGLADPWEDRVTGCGFEPVPEIRILLLGRDDGLLDGEFELVSGVRFPGVKRV